MELPGLPAARRALEFTRSAAAITHYVLYAGRSRTTPEKEMVSVQATLLCQEIRANGAPSQDRLAEFSQGFMQLRGTDSIEALGLEPEQVTQLTPFWESHAADNGIDTLTTDEASEERRATMAGRPGMLRILGQKTVELAKETGKQTLLTTFRVGMRPLELLDTHECTVAASNAQVYAGESIRQEQMMDKLSEDLADAELGGRACEVAISLSNKLLIGEPGPIENHILAFKRLMEVLPSAHKTRVHNSLTREQRTVLADRIGVIGSE